ncbi:hypothetical protein P885DRAFT_28240 [Corynascus similis CBS 632.67]
MATDFSRLTVIELRQELKRRNLSQTGKKADLIERLATFESDQTASEAPDNSSVDNNHGALDSAANQGTEEPQNGDHLNSPQPENAAEAAELRKAEEVPQAPIADQDVDDAPGIANEAPDPAGDSELIQDSTTESGAEKQNAEVVPAREIITDAVNRKRRSRSPPPETESSRKRARASDDQVTEGDLPGDDDLRPQNPAEPQPMPAPQPATGNHTESRESSRYIPEDQHIPTEERDTRQDRLISPRRSDEQAAVDEPNPDYDRDVEPALHPATPALYIKNFMRPLREPVLQDHLIELAAFPGAAPDPDCLVHFFLDQIRTHALVSFTSVAAASRVRTALHGTVWPNERNRKALWVDFIPEDKVDEWIKREQSEGARSSNRWEVEYLPDDNGIITANLVNAEMGPSRRDSVRQPVGPPVPTGPARNYPGVEGAPLGPRGRGTNHYRQAPMPPPAFASVSGDRDRFEDHDRARGYKTTRAYPPLEYKPVSEDVALRRSDNMNAHITKDRRRDLGRPDEINRYTFEDGDLFVDRGKEAFIGIRPPHRERERRRMGVTRGGGGGNRGGPPPRQRTPSPRRVPRSNDDGYRGGRRDDYDRDAYRDRRDDRDRDRMDVPRSRFDGQPLPTFTGGGGGGRRGGRWGGGGGGRDRY